LSSKKKFIIVPHRYIFFLLIAVAGETQDEKVEKEAKEEKKTHSSI
jgi:hypothetical protein